MKNHRKISLITVLLISGIFQFTFAQRQSGNSGDFTGITLSGTIADSVSQIPLEYSTVILYSQPSNEQAGGTITDADGRFELARLRPGNYTLKMDYIGYESRSIQGVSLAPGKPVINLGRLLLKPAVLESEGVEVSAEKPTFEYQIDKKVINVSRQPTVISGTAVDVLENVPSITTDIDGNVQLRGSSNFTVLIDNRPTVLESNDALQQIPAGTIENIEIITNPSAKFDPEGTSGIINIITKVNKKQGITGIMNLTGSLENRRNGGDILLSRRTSKFNFFLGGDLNNRNFPRDSESERRTMVNDTTYHNDSKGSGSWGGGGWGFRGGVDYSMTEKDLLTLSFRAGGRSHDGDSRNDYVKWTEPGDAYAAYISQDKSTRDGTFYSVKLDYKKNFTRQGHELLGSLNFSNRDGDEESINELRDVDNSIAQAQRFLESGPSNEIRFNLDYTLPLREKDKFQAGMQSEFENSEDETERYDYSLADKVYQLQPLYSHIIDYKDNYHALYTMYAVNFNHLGFQGGLRAEYTDRGVKLTDTGENFTINQWDYFPTAHLSYTLTKGRQMMASYTRRIHRPRGWELEPFETWTDAYNVRRGNPELKPEYIDSYEMGYQTFWGRNLVSLEGYYRITNNTIERVQSVYSANVQLQTTENIGNEYTFGAEFMTNVDLSKWWNINLMGTLYNYKVEGILFDQNFSRESRNWNIRLNNTFKLTENTRLQLTGRYNSPTVSSQGRREDFYMVDMGLKQNFFDRSLSATLQIRDLLNTGKWEFSSEGPNFYTHYIFKHSQMIALTITYNINNYKQQRRQDTNNEDNNGGAQPEEMQEGGESY